MSSGSGKRRVGATVFALFVIMALAVFLWPRVDALLADKIARDIEAGPIVARDASGQAVLVTLLTHTQSRWSRSGGGRGTRLIAELQFNRMSDAADLGRVAVHTSSLSSSNVYLLGAESDRVWIFADGLRGVSVSRRSVEIDPATIEARLPQLKGQLPDDPRYYELHFEGSLRLTARDGSRHLLDPEAWTLLPQPEPTPSPPARDWNLAMQEWSVRNDEAMATTFAQQPGEYGLDSWRTGGGWLGIFSETEQRNFSRRWDRPRKHNNTTPERRKLWTAQIVAELDGLSELGEMRSLGDKAYLRGGFLRDGKRLRPVQLKGSSDLIVEHYSAIDNSAQMLLTRVTPAGEERWTATLPLKLPNTINATDEYVAFRGLPPGTTYLHRAQLVCLRLSDGSFSTFSFN